MYVVYVLLLYCIILYDIYLLVNLEFYIIVVSLLLMVSLIVQRPQ